jgi:hypothetical protein
VDVTDDKIIAVKVFSFPKKKKVRAVSENELMKFERGLKRETESFDQKTLRSNPNPNQRSCHAGAVACQ